MEITKSIAGIKVCQMVNTLIPCGLISDLNSDTSLHKLPSINIYLYDHQLPFSYPVGHKGLCTQVAYDETAGLIAVLTEDYCVQFFSLFDNHEVSQVSNLPLPPFYDLKLSVYCSIVFLEKYIYCEHSDIFQVQVCKRNFQPVDDVTVRNKLILDTRILL